MNNALNWFEIPSTDFDRAVMFYSTILEAPLRREMIAGTLNAFLPYDNNADNAVGGAIIFDAQITPSAHGTVPYLNCNGRLDEVLARVIPAGGKVILPHIDFPFGSIATILDTEGNRIGLHSA